MNTITNPYTGQAIPLANEMVVNGDTYLVEAIANDLGDAALRMVEEEITNPCFSVNYCFDAVDAALSNGYFPEMALFHHHLIVPKDTVDIEMVEEVKQVFQAEAIVVLDNELLFEVYLDEGPYAPTINAAIYEINEGIGVIAKSLIEKVGLVEYQLVFNITEASC